MAARIPEKFRDPQSGALRIDALLKSYAQLERRLGQMVSVPGEDSGAEDQIRFRRALGVPDSPEEYQVQFDDARFSADPAVVKTRDDKARASWMAVVPIPLEPP